MAYKQYHDPAGQDSWEYAPEQPRRIQEGETQYDPFAKQREEQADTGGGMRFNEGKARLMFNLLCQEVSQLEAEVWEKGAEKYDAGNWLKGQSAMKAADSVLRHLTALMNGEDIDPESGSHHGGHLICATKILVNALINHDGKYDDRPTTLLNQQGSSSQKLQGLQAAVKQAQADGVFTRDALDPTDDGC